MKTPNKPRAELEKEVRSLRAKLNRRVKRMQDLEGLLIESKKQLEGEEKAYQNLLKDRDDWKKEAHETGKLRNAAITKHVAAEKKLDEACRKLTVAENEIEELKRGLTQLDESYGKRTEELKVSQSNLRHTADALEAYKKASRRHLSPETVAEKAESIHGEVAPFVRIFCGESDETVPAKLVVRLLQRIEERLDDFVLDAMRRGNLTRRNSYCEVGAEIQG